MLDWARPELVAFLSALRETGDAYWQTHTPETLDDFRARGVGGTTWASGTRWMARWREDEIDALEATHGLTFPPDHRAFLALLGGTNAPAVRYAFGAADLERVGDCRVFPDWLSDGTVVADAADDLLRGILFDVEQNDLWLEDWGPRPDDEAARGDGVARRLAEAPTLIPLHGHRYLVEGLELSPAPVLSVVQSDVILYATSIEHCLAADFPALCDGLDPGPVDPALQRLQCERLAEVPFWGGFLT